MHSTERATRTVLSLEMACYHAAHDFRGGAEALAAMMGVSGAVLRNRLNPNVANHVLSARDAAKIAEITQDRRILYAMAQAFGAHVSFADPCENNDVMLSHSIKEFSDFMGAFAGADKNGDGKIDADEKSEVRKEWNECVSIGTALVEKL